MAIDHCMVHESRENERAEGEEGDVCNDDVDSDGRYKARTRTRRWNTGSVVCRQWYCRFVFTVQYRTVQYSKVYYIIIVISIIISIIMLFFCFAYATAFLQQVACPCTCPSLPFLAHSFSHAPLSPTSSGPVQHVRDTAITGIPQQKILRLE